MVELRGKVVKGIGEGRKYVEIYSMEIEKTLGFKPFPGTLNVLLDKESIHKIVFIYNTKPYAIIKPPFNGLADVYVWKCYIAKSGNSDKMESYIVRSAKTVHDVSVVELISSECIRKRLGLSDDDAVEIVVLLESTF
ncbi:MAG: DUF120 domain-containing protein [Ignisphaera sp.]